MKKRELVKVLENLTAIAEAQQAQIDLLAERLEATIAINTCLVAELETTKILDGAKVAIKSADGHFLSAGIYGRPMDVVTVGRRYGDHEVFTLELQP